MAIYTIVLCARLFLKIPSVLIYNTYVVEIGFWGFFTWQVIYLSILSRLCSNFEEQVLLLQHIESEVDRLNNNHVQREV